MTRRKVIDEIPEAQPDLELPLHLKYRPARLEDMIGQDAVVDALRANMKAKTRPHSFLFTGPAGSGKTTLSRIVAAMMDCMPANIVELDAASNSGIDNMRELIQTTRYQGFGASPNKAFIIDECHRLSKPAWDALLKPIEEPPPHVYFFFCTTESDKVPKTILTRCQSYNLKPLRRSFVMDLLEMVADKEDLKASDDVLELVADACEGSARQALVMLAMVRDVEDPDEAASILEAPLENSEIIDLCRALIDRKLSWERLVGTLRGMPEMQAESIRIVLANYLAGCLMNAKKEAEIIRLSDVLRPFSKPFNQTDKLAPLLLAFSDLIYD